jgi:hypothetical protein
LCIRKHQDRGDIIAAISDAVTRGFEEIEDTALT